MPICPSYGCNLYGLKQSSLIQWSRYRRSISNGFDYYARLPDCDIDRMCNSDKVCNFRENTSVDRKRGGLRKCFVYEERSKMYDLGGVDEAEAILSLLTEDIGEECFVDTKETRRLVRKPVVEKRETGGVCRECGSKNDRVELGVSESGREVMASLRKDDSRRRKERIQIEENEQAILREEHEGSSLKNRREEREKEEREALLRKASQKSVDKQDRELMRKKNLKLRARTEEKDELLRREHRQMVGKDSSRRDQKEELLRREEHMQKVRRDGSSCSSYYSFSSNGDYGSEDEVELAEGRYLENSSTDHKSYSRNNELVYQDTREEDQRREGYRDDNGSSLANRRLSKEFHTGSGVVECDFRKKSEKRLADVSVEEMESRTETSLKESKFAISHERSLEKSSNYDDRNEKSTESTKFDEERKQQLRQTGGEVSRQSETMLKYKQFVGTEDIHSGNVVDTTRSQKVYTGMGEISAKVVASNQGRSSREDEYRMNEFDELNEVIVTNSGNTSAIQVEDRNNNKTKTPVRTPLDLSEVGMLSLGSTAGVATDDTNSGSLQLESTNLHGINIQGSVINPEAYGGAETNSSHGQPSKFISDEDGIGSAARLEKSSTHYVGEFVEQARSEILSSQIQREKEICTAEILHGESSGDPRTIEHDLVGNNQPSGTKGPSDEMWNVDEQSVQEPSKAEVQDNASNASNVIVKRTGRSLWNTIGDIVRFRWLAHSENHDSSRKTGGRSSPNQSTGSERWFSGHEAEENEEALEEKDGGSSALGLSGRHQQGKTGSQIVKSFSSSTLEGHLGQAGMNAPSSSVTQERSSLQASIYLPTGGGISGDTSSAAIIDPSIPLPALRLRRSPAVRGVPDAGEAQASGSGTSEQIDTGLVEHTELVVNEQEVKEKKLQRKDQVVRDRFGEWEEAYRLEVEQRKIDEMFMREALLESQKAADSWEVPVGAVLVHSGKIIARGCNL